MINFPELIGYFEIDHTADIAIAVTGNSVESLFIQSFSALKKIANVKLTTNAIAESSLSLKAKTIESLLVAFLNEMLILIESRKCPVCKQLKIRDNHIKFSYSLFECEVRGAELKAVTYNMLNIIEHAGYFSTIIVFDI